MNFVFITGGVISSLGKGIITASIASILEELDLKINVIKLDPYLNVDAGTMNPLEHGEVFVTFDGGETDLDIGHYERFTNISFSKNNNITSGQIYLSVIEKERQGYFLGQTIQVIPHVINEIKEKIYNLSNNFDITIVEIGGTVGDIESLPFLEAARQIKIDYPNTIFIHLTYVPWIKNTNELKTKPTQHSLKELRSIGIQPDILITRSTKKIDKLANQKIALFSNLKLQNVLNIPNLSSVYLIPLTLIKRKLHKTIIKKLKVNKKVNINRESRWSQIKELIIQKKSYPKVTIGIVGKYTKLQDSYKSLSEALLHSSLHNKINLSIDWIDSEEVNENNLHKFFKNIDGVIIPGGFGKRGIDGKISIIKFSRNNNIPIIGICLGLQLMIVEFTRNVLKIKEANSTEFDISTKFPIIDLLENQRKFFKEGKLQRFGGTMRLGNYKCYIKPNTLAHKIYNNTVIEERHRHRYEVNLELLQENQESFYNNGLIISGINNETNLVEIIELSNHPFFIGVQFHPEFNSRIFKPNPLFNYFLLFLKNRKNSENKV